MSESFLKKGMEKEQMVILILAVIMAVIIIMFIGKQTAFAGQRTKDIACKQSVIQSVQKGEAWAATNVDWADLLNCPVHYLTLDTDEKNFNEQISNEIVKCWDKMGEGQQSLFANEDAVFCVVCAVIEEFEGDKPIENSMIEQYMKNHNVQNKQIKIWDYLVGADINATKFAQLDKSKPTAILYIHGKNAYAWSTETARYEFTHQGKVYWPAIKGAVSWFAGWDVSAEWDARWAIVAYEQDTLKNLGCEVIEQ